MPALTPETHGDLQQTTIARFERRKFTEIATNLSKYHVFRNLILFADDKGKNVRMGVQAGDEISFRAMLNHNGASSHTTMGAPDNPVSVDVFESASVPWKFTTTQYGILQQVVSMNKREPEKIVDYYDGQDMAALISAAVLFEDTFWGAPVASTDTTTPYGAFTWFPKMTGDGGFNGAFPTGFTTLGLDNEHDRWKHYGGAYTDLSDDDLLYKMWIACLSTDFESPIDQIPHLKGPMQRGIYTNTPTYVRFAMEAQSRNDNLGPELTKYNGGVYFQGSLVQRVPKLDADTTDPVVGLDWGSMKWYAHEDWWAKRLTQKNYPGQHTTDVFFIDWMHNLVCYSRRQNFVFAKGTTYPG